MLALLLVDARGGWVDARGGRWMHAKGGWVDAGGMLVDARGAPRGATGARDVSVVAHAAAAAVLFRGRVGGRVQLIYPGNP
eukprot:7242351-Pyramimonas_sp.AAC.2